MAKHLLTLTKVYENEVELTEDEYQKYLKDPDAFLDPYWLNADVVFTEVEDEELGDE